jgi:hypothetical protein
MQEGRQAGNTAILPMRSPLEKEGILMSRRAIIVIGVLFMIPSIARAQSIQLRDVVGVNHIGGMYNFNGPWPVPAGDTNRRDYLNEGADEIYNAGSRVIKVWLHPNSIAFYPFTANPGFPFGFPYFKTPAERLAYMAQSEQWTRLFDKPFTTFVINVMANIPVNDANGAEDISKFGFYSTMLDGLTTAEAAAEKAAIQNFATWLLQRYQNSNKTFIIQNWEGDWILRDGLAEGVTPSATRIQAMRDWLNARQDGIVAARNAVGSVGVNVLGAIEVNRVADAVNNVPGTLTNDVLPYTHSDLYNYSCYDAGVGGRDPGALHDQLVYLQSKAPDNALFGNRNIGLSEFGSAENIDAGGSAAVQKATVRRMTEVALGFGCRYAIIWQVYCNEPKTADQLQPGEQLLQSGQRPTNQQMRGFWLVRPDGSHSALYQYVQWVTGQSMRRIALRASSGYYVSPDEGGGFAIRANAPWIREWEYLTAIDHNGGEWNSGDEVSVLTWRGNYFNAYDGGGQYMDATATTTEAPSSTPTASTPQRFYVTKTSGTGLISAGNSVSLRTRTTGHYAYPQNGGGPGDLFFWADATAVGTYQTFVVATWP